MPSTVIRHFRYQLREHQLDIEFVTGRRYRYLDVPARIYARMCLAFSKGEYFNRVIRGHFVFVRLDDVKIAS